MSDPSNEGSAQTEAPGPEAIQPENFRKGERDPFFARKVQDLIEIHNGKWVVFLNDRWDTYWWYEHDTPKGFGGVTARIAELEAIQIDRLSRGNQRAFRTLVANGAARAFNDGSSQGAHAILDKAAEFVNARLAEKSRLWYLCSSLFAVGVLGLIHVLLRHPMVSTYATVETFVAPFREIGTLITVGGLGASFWMILRMGDFPVDPASGFKLHVLEAFARIAGGALGGWLTHLAAKSGMLSDAVSSNSTAVFLMAFASGATERFVPNLVNRVPQAGFEDGARPGRPPRSREDPAPGHHAPEDHAPEDRTRGGGRAGDGTPGTPRTPAPHEGADAARP